MKKIWIWLLCAVAITGLQASAQDITGTWQGTLAAGQGLRTVVKISRNDGVLKSVFYSIDQGGQPIPVTKTLLSGSALTFKIDGLDLVYEGKFDGANTITGNSTQGGHALALNLTRATPETAWAIPEPPVKLPAMAKDADPSFDVATIKPAKPGAIGPGFRIQQRSFEAYAATINDLIEFGYGLSAKQLAGGAPWMETERFDVAAKPDGEGSPSSAQWRLMLRKMLVERLGLKFHLEKRDLPVYAVTVSKGGPKMSVSEADPNAIGGCGFGAPGIMRGNNASIKDFAEAMQAVAMDRPVVDQTGLTGRYNFSLKWTPDESQFPAFSGSRPPPSDAADAPPSLYVAIQEQIGLKIEAVKAPLDVMVVEKVDKPSQN